MLLQIVGSQCPPFFQQGFHLLDVLSILPCHQQPQMRLQLPRLLHFLHSPLQLGSSCLHWQLQWGQNHGHPVSGLVHLFYAVLFPFSFGSVWANAWPAAAESVLVQTAGRRSPPVHRNYWEAAHGPGSAPCLLHRVHAPCLHRFLFHRRHGYPLELGARKEGGLGKVVQVEVGVGVGEALYKALVREEEEEGIDAVGPPSQVGAYRSTQNHRGYWCWVGIQKRPSRLGPLEAQELPGYPCYWLPACSRCWEG
mmetsp:Transcript_34522/g.45635  ORF Transcript_34522/g.45635 Transcript_34522/m.45635 type:complete len:252 (-) Transcript_34522:1799-2554(-)